MKPVFTEEGLRLVKANGKIIQEAIKANEKALDEGKWYLSSKTSEGKPRKRSTYVQYLRGKMDALKELADGVELQPWKPADRTIPIETNIDIQAIVAKAVAEALRKAK